MNKAKILYVEDDLTLGFITKDNLELNKYEVNLCTDGLSALKEFEKKHFDICLLDVMLPEMDGFTLAEKIRRINHEIPIIFLTAKSLKEDKIKGLTIGGDDYITKPYSIEELMLKIEIFLKRKYIPHKDNETDIQIIDFKLDMTNLQLFHKGELVKNMTQKEANLLQLLYENKNQTIKRSVILKKLWGTDDYFLGRSMDVFISRLRKNLKPNPAIKIENVHGVGFRLVIDE